MREHLSADPSWCAPDLLPTEVFSALRGLWLGGIVTPDRAQDALDALDDIAVDLVPTARPGTARFSSRERASAALRQPPAAPVG